MSLFIEGLDRQQTMLLPEHLDDYVDEHNPVRAIDAFADMLDLAVLGFNGQPAATGRPGYHPGLMLRIYLYGYLNQVQSSRRLERECGRNLELIWLTDRLKPDFKTIADFRKDNGTAANVSFDGLQRSNTSGGWMSPLGRSWRLRFAREVNMLRRI